MRIIIFLSLLFAFNLSNAQTINSTVFISGSSSVQNTAIATDKGVALAGVVAVSKTDNTQVKDILVYVNSSNIKTNTEAGSGKTACAGVVCVIQKTK